MTAAKAAQQRYTLRERTYTYYEMLAFAQYFHEHRTESTPVTLLSNFFKIKHAEGEYTAQQHKLMAIEETTCLYYGLNLQDVRGKRRYAELVRARQVVMYFAVQHASQSDVAACLGTNRNNVQHSKTKCASLMTVEPQLRREVAEVVERLTPIFADIEKRYLPTEANTNENENTKEHSL